jgi:hypothetical protein
MRNRPTSKRPRALAIISGLIGLSVVTIADGGGARIVGSVLGRGSGIGSREYPHIHSKTSSLEENPGEEGKSQLDDLRRKGRGGRGAQDCGRLRVENRSSSSGEGERWVIGQDDVGFDSGEKRVTSWGKDFC